MLFVRANNQRVGSQLILQLQQAGPALFFRDAFRASVEEAMEWGSEHNMVDRIIALLYGVYTMYEPDEEILGDILIRAYSLIRSLHIYRGVPPAHV